MGEGGLCTREGGGDTQHSITDAALSNTLDSHRTQTTHDAGHP